MKVQVSYKSLSELIVVKVNMLLTGIIVGFDVTTASVSEGQIWMACVEVFVINIPTSITVEVLTQSGTAEGDCVHISK